MDANRKSTLLLIESNFMAAPCFDKVLSAILVILQLRRALQFRIFLIKCYNNILLLSDGLSISKVE